MTVNDLAQLPQFGTECLNDLVAAILNLTEGSAAPTELDLRALVETIKSDGVVPRSLYGAHLPTPAVSSLNELRLQPRTFNVLERAGYGKPSKENKRWTIGELLSLRGFGTECLIDLVCVLLNFTEESGGLPELDLRAIVETITSDGVVPRSFYRAHLPTPEVSALTELRLQARTFNALERAGYGRPPLKDKRWTIGELLSLRGFGTECLLDLVRELHCLTEGELEDYWLASPDGKSPLHLEDVAEHLISRIPGRQYGSPRFSEDHVQALVWRFGLDGRPKPTLQECGDRVGLSRERIRQIETRYLDKIKHPRHIECDPLPDVLAQTFDIALESLTGSGNIGRTLQDRGLSKHDEWAPEHLIALARLCGHRNIESSLQEIADDQPPPQLDRLLPMAAWQASANSGFCHESACLRRLKEMWLEQEIDHLLPKDVIVRDHIAKHPSIVDLPDGYLYSPGSGDPVRRLGGQGARITRLLTKMLTVSSPLRISELRQGLIRNKRFTKVPFDLPSQVLKAFCEWHPDFHVDDDNFVSTTIDLSEISGLVGWLVTQIRNSDYGFLTYTQAIGMARKQKQSTNSLGIWLTYAPEIARDRRGLYYPIGEPPSERLVHQGLKAAGLTAVPTSQKWTYKQSERVVRLDVEIGNSSLVGTIHVTSADYGYLDLLGERKFPIIDPNGECHGNLFVGRSMKFVTGLATYFSHKSVEVGDEIEITIDLEKQVASVDL